jgi:hypothetical protein
MAIRVECPGCHKGIQASEQHLGKRAKCPACGAAVLIASPAPIVSHDDQPAPVAQRKSDGPWWEWKITVPVAVCLALIWGFVGLAIGWFGGRFWMAIELRNAVDVIADKLGK